MPWRTRGACNTPDNSRAFGYVMGLNGLGVIWFCYPLIGKLFSEEASNLTALDVIVSLLPIPYFVTCVIWMIGIFQQKPMCRLVAMICFGIILFSFIVCMIVLPSEEYQAKGGFITLMIVFAGFSLISGVISHIQMKKLELIDGTASTSSQFIKIFEHHGPSGQKM